MKEIVKCIIEFLGLSDTIKKVIKSLKLRKERKLLSSYKKINTWFLNQHNLNLQYDTSDWYSKRWFFPRYDNGKIHEPTATKIFIDEINSNSQVLDIGGHLGYFSCIAGFLAKNGNVHVFEVDPKCLNLINKNIEVNKLDNVFVHNYAVSNINESIKIPKYDTPNPSLIINNKFSNNDLEVNSIIIDEFLIQEGIIPDFIKIDVEGAEWKVLEGMKKTLANSKVTLLIEIHVEILRNHFDTDYKEIIKLLIDNNYSIQETEHRTSNEKLRDLDLNSTLKGNTMILCKK